MSQKSTRPGGCPQLSQKTGYLNTLHRSTAPTALTVSSVYTCPKGACQFLEYKVGKRSVFPGPNYSIVDWGKRTKPLSSWINKHVAAWLKVPKARLCSTLAWRGIRGCGHFERRGSCLWGKANASEHNLRLSQRQTWVLVGWLRGPQLLGEEDTDFCQGCARWQKYRKESPSCTQMCPAVLVLLRLHTKHTQWKDVEFSSHRQVDL